MRNILVALTITVTSAVLYLQPLQAQASESPGFCSQAHQRACKDLTGAAVVTKEVTPSALRSLCGSKATACAQLRLNDSGASCTIYHTGREILPDSLNHEMNHCRGWQHNSTKYSRPWKPLKEVLNGNH